MNKQEFQQTIKNMKCKKDCVYMSSFSVYQKGFEKAKELALLHSNSLDEPEKPVLTKAEAEWVEGLKEEQERRPFWTKYSALYFITRCGFGYGFSYDHNGREIELKHYPHETHVEKERLANAILYGYEVEKEKLYYVNIPNVYHGDFGYSETHDNYSFYNKSDATEIRFELTESEIKLEHEWAWQFTKEVEE